jgi:putative ABC transport system permease protein
MIPISYNYRNLLVRWKTTVMTACAFMLVVAAVVIMLAFVGGIESVCASSGQPENVLVLSRGGRDEVTSTLDKGQAIRIENTPGVLRSSGTGEGELLASRELYMNIGCRVPADGPYQLLQVRGVTPVAFDVHTQVKVTSGRMMRPSQSEIVVGRGLQRQRGIQLGEKYTIGPKEWTVVGIFDANSSTFETEVWVDLTELAGAVRRDGSYSAIVLRTHSGAAARKLVDMIANNRSLSVTAQTESNYYAKIAEEAGFLRTASLVIAGFMAVGAAFGITNTMFAAISQRVKDIAVLRILGFAKPDILVSFLLEALLIAALGSVIGIGLSYLVNGVSLTTAIGSKSVAFAFAVNRRAIITSVIFTFVTAFLGGLLPAMSAMRVTPLESFR